MDPTEAAATSPAWVLVRTDDALRSNGQPIYFHQLVGGEWLPVVAARPHLRLTLGLGKVSYYVIDPTRLDAGRRAQLIEGLAGMFRRNLAYAEAFFDMGFQIPADRVDQVSEGPGPDRALLTTSTGPQE